MKNPSSSLVIELYDLKVSPKSKKQFGRVVTTQTLSEDDIIRRIAERGCELHPSTIKAALELYREMAEEQLLNGASVTMGPADLLPGEYQLKLTTQYSNSSTLVSGPRTAMPLVNPIVS